jgi:hypothetical protein
MNIDYVERARALLGIRFRPQGRSEAELDCVGVILMTFEIASDGIRRNYRLRGDHEREIRSGLNRHFRRVPESQLRPGDVMLLRVAEEQLHLAVRTDRGFVHGHARIGRVVETPGLPAWPLLGAYRKRRRA